MTDPQRILLIRPSALGDVCRTVPVLVSLRRRYPDAAIDWLVNDTFRAAIEAHPDLTGIVEFPRGRFAPMWRRPSLAAEFRRWLRTLRDASYDLVLDCQGLARSGAIAWATRAARRVGYSNAEEFGWVGLNESVFAPRESHAVDRMLEIARQAGAPPVVDMRLYTPPTDREAMDPRLRGRSFVVVAPSSRWSGKRWPASRFGAIARRLLEETDAGAIAVVGGPGEEAQCEPLRALAREEDRIVDLVGRTSIGGLMAVIEASRLVIANDSAAVHMAVGFDRPLVALFGPTDIGRVGPYRREHDVLQARIAGERIDYKNGPLGAAMMERIEVDDVFRAAVERLARSPAGSKPREVSPVA